MLLDDHARTSTARPGTSMRQTGRMTARGGLEGVLRPTTSSNRVMTGFARPGTASRLNTGSKTARLATALRGGGRVGTARVQTSLGRMVRIGTASLQGAIGGAFIDSSRLDLSRYATRPALSKALMDWILFVEANMKRALELAELCIRKSSKPDWWWYDRRARASFRLNLIDNALQDWKMAISLFPNNPALYVQTARVYRKLDQPQQVLEVYASGLDKLAVPCTALMYELASVSMETGNVSGAIHLWKRILKIDPSYLAANVSLAYDAFVTGHPEIAANILRRVLLFKGTQSVPPELWCNLALACFHSNQFNLALPCIERALKHATEPDLLADIWYNIGCLLAATKDNTGSIQAYRLALSYNPLHPEANVNMGVMEKRKGNLAQAAQYFQTAHKADPASIEPLYNYALLEMQRGHHGKALTLVQTALELNPLHDFCLRLQSYVQQQLHIP